MRNLLVLAFFLVGGCRKTLAERAVAEDDTSPDVAAQLCVTAPERYSKGDCRKQTLRDVDELIAQVDPYWLRCETAVEATRLFAPERLPSIRGKCCELLARHFSHPEGCRP